MPQRIWSLRVTVHMDICLLLGNNQLIARHVFRYRPKIWKPLVSSTMDQMLAALLAKESGSEWNAPDWCLSAVSAATESIRSAMYHWRMRHFEYAMDHGFCEFAALITKHAESIEERFFRQMMVVWYYGPIMFIFTSLGQSRTLGKRFLNTTMVAADIHNVSLPDWRRLTEKDLSPEYFEWIRPYHDMMPCGDPRAVPCSLPSCKRDGTEERKMYLCKGCKLVRYCCRNHQKKHWKFIHSQQCKSFRHQL